MSLWTGHIKKFLRLAKLKDSFLSTILSSPKKAVIAAHVLQHAVLRFLVKDVEGIANLKKTKICKMNVEPTAKIDRWTNTQKTIGNTNMFFRSQMFGFSVSLTIHRMLIETHASSKTFFRPIPNFF